MRKFMDLQTSKQTSKINNSSQQNLNAKKLDFDFDSDDFFNQMTAPAQAAPVNKAGLIETKSDVNPFALSSEVP